MPTHHTFLEILEAYLHALSWNMAVFARESGIPETLLADPLCLRQVHINKMVLVLCKEIERRIAEGNVPQGVELGVRRIKPKRTHRGRPTKEEQTRDSLVDRHKIPLYGVTRVDEMFLQLSNSLGLGLRRNSQLNRRLFLDKKPLRVGWVPSPAISQTGSLQKLVGWGTDLIELLALVMGFGEQGIEWRSYPTNERSCLALEKRQIELSLVVPCIPIPLSFTTLTMIPNYSTEGTVDLPGASGFLLKMPSAVATPSEEKILTGMVKSGMQVLSDLGFFSDSGPKNIFPRSGR